MLQMACEFAALRHCVPRVLENQGRAIDIVGLRFPSFDGVVSLAGLGMAPIKTGDDRQGGFRHDPGSKVIGSRKEGREAEPGKMRLGRERLGWDGTLEAAVENHFEERDGSM